MNDQLVIQVANELGVDDRCNCAPCRKIRDAMRDEGLTANRAPQDDDVLPIPVMNFDPEPEQDRAPVANTADDDDVLPVPTL